MKHLKRSDEPGTASIGLRAKTGRAIVVVLCGPADAPRVLRRVEVRLTDPEVRATGQPYHSWLALVCFAGQ